jgi:flagellar protein FlgJ
MGFSIDPKVFVDQAAAAGDKRLHRDDSQALREACQEFEAFFIQAMFKGMRSTIPDGGLIEKGFDTKTFQELMDTEVSRQMARKQGLGIAEALYWQLQGEKSDK